MSAAAANRAVGPESDIDHARGMLAKDDLEAGDSAWLRSAIERNRNDLAVSGFLTGIGRQLDQRSSDRAFARIAAASAAAATAREAALEARRQRWCPLSPTTRAAYVLHEKKSDEISRAILQAALLAERDLTAVPADTFEPTQG